MPKFKVFSFSRKKVLKFRVYYFFKLEIKCSNWLILPMGGVRERVGRRARKEIGGRVVSCRADVTGRRQVRNLRDSL